jgi:tRNA threonylcarbamoyladenosine biosynthesis protein TsaB
VLLLALDTCDSRGSVAVLDGDRVLNLEIHNSSEDYSSWLLPCVARVLQASEASLPEVQAYAVATGPGSFTGVRVGLTTVKAWSEIHGKPIAPVSRLEALASYSSGKFPCVAVFTDAQRGQVFGAAYRPSSSGLERVEVEMVTAPEAFLDFVVSEAKTDRIEWISPDPMCLARTENWPARLALAESVYVVAPILAPSIGRLALKLVKEGRLTDALSLDANYVRRSDAEIFWKGGSGYGR